MTSYEKSRPLAGLRIVEFAGIGPGPFAAMLLADMGAEVIRIDRPGGADPWSGPIIRRGRRSVTADLKNSSHKSDILRLLRKADALIEGYRPGVMERLGLGPEVVHAINPRIAYGRMTGFGQSGPLAQAAGHDITYIATSGALHAFGPAERPLAPLNMVGDMGGGALYLVAGLLAAMLSARITGEGRVVDCAITDGSAHLVAMIADLAVQGRWDGARREANILDGAAPFYRCYPCRGGGFVAVGALEPPFFAAFCKGLGIETVPEAERMERANWPALAARFGAILATRTREEWAAVFEGTDACVAPVLTLEEAASHPHNRARGTFMQAGGVMQPAPAPRFAASAGAINLVPPDFADLNAALAAWQA